MRRNRRSQNSNSGEENHEDRGCESGSKQSDNIEMELLPKTTSGRDPKHETPPAVVPVVNRRCPRTQIVKKRREKSTIILVSVVLVSFDDVIDCASWGVKGGRTGILVTLPVTSLMIIFLAFSFISRTNKVGLNGGTVKVNLLVSCSCQEVSSNPCCDLQLTVAKN